MMYVAIAGFACAFLTALGAWLFSERRGTRIDTLQGQLRDTALVAQAGRQEVVELHAGLKEANDRLTEERRSHSEEVAVLNRDLQAARTRIAASSTPDGIREGLTRRPPPSSATPPTGERAVLPSVLRTPAAAEVKAAVLDRATTTVTPSPKATKPREGT